MAIRNRTLTTLDQVIDALGGGVEFCRRYNRTKQQLYNDRVRGRLPSRIYERCKHDLQKVRCTASPELWGIEEPRAA